MEEQSATDRSAFLAIEPRTTAIGTSRRSRRTVRIVSSLTSPPRWFREDQPPTLSQ